MRNLPPVTGNFTDWASALSRALTFGWSLLEYKNSDSRATQDGILMWDPSLDLMVVSRDSAWVPVRDETATAFGKLTAAHVLTSTTAAQKLFNWSTDGALTLQPGEYVFRSMIRMDSLSATSGNAQLLFGGTSTRTRHLWYAFGQDAANPVTVAALSGSGAFATSGEVNVITPTVATQLMVVWQGSFTVTAAGTLIPQIALTTAAAAQVLTGSWFAVERVGAAATIVGAWS